MGNHHQLFDIALYVLRHFNEGKMQRRVATFIYLCSQMTEIFYDKSPKVVETILGCIPIAHGMSHHNLSRTFIVCGQRIPNIKDIVYSALKSNPYEGLSEVTVKLLLNLTMVVIDPSTNVPMNVRERNFMMIIRDLQDLVKTGEIPSRITQLEFRLALWKKNNGLN